MNEMWIIGVVGGGAGAAVGGPLLLRGGTKGEPWTTEQLGGLWLLGAAIAMLLIGIRHGELLAPGWDQVVEHVTNALSIVAWTTLVSLTRRMGRLSPLIPGGPVTHVALPALYLLIIAAAGNPDLRFLWLIPVGVAGVIANGVAWRAALATGNAESVRQVGTVFAFSILFCGAQGIRSLFPHVTEVREIVPAVMTLSIFAIAFVLAGRRLGAASSPPNATVAAEPGRVVRDGPQYRKSGLTVSEADRLVEELDARMRASGWHREPDLSLAELASRLRVGPQMLSQALNQRRRKSLPEYLAERRMRDARQLLLNPANDCFTVEGLARQAGFASRSAFYKLFRSAEGVTPTQYRERARRNRSELTPIRENQAEGGAARPRI
ncbi:MAG TPA: helix-turn-helix transcriptional regulator [Gemmatimonadaceae bacterium]